MYYSPWPVHWKDRLVTRLTFLAVFVARNSPTLLSPLRTRNVTVTTVIKGLGLQASALSVHPAWPLGLHPHGAVPQRVPLDHLCLGRPGEQWQCFRCISNGSS